MTFTDEQLLNMRESGVMVRVELDSLFLVAEMQMEMMKKLHEMETPTHTRNGKAQCVGYHLCLELLAHIISIGVSEMVESN